MDRDDRHEPPTIERTIWLVRHAQAAARTPDGDDPARPLIEKGLDQAGRLAAALRAWEADIDVVLSSPWLRAAATAEVLRGAAPVRYVEALAAADPAAASASIVAALGPSEREVLVVGHEPWLSALASWWLSGDDLTVRLAFRKAAAMALVGVPSPGGMTLTGFVSMRWVKALQTSGEAPTSQR